MKHDFISVASEFTSDLGLLDSLWQELEKHYTHKSRHYHNLDHVENLLRLLSDHKSDVDDWASLFLAVVYHDAVYNVLKSDNEEKSASMAEKRLAQIHFPAPRINVCKDLILATKSHTMAPNQDANLLMDADLSILGADWDTYSAYTEQVRKEYSIYPDWAYKPGRKKVLAKFLERDFIFKTPDFRERFEASARKNIQQEILSLQ